MENEIEVDITVTKDEEEVVSLAASNSVSNTSSSTEKMQKQLWKKIDLILTIQSSWQNVIDDATRVALVTKGPVRITEYDFPKIEDQNIRRFKEIYYKRKLNNG